MKGVCIGAQIVEYRDPSSLIIFGTIARVPNETREIGTVPWAPLCETRNFPRECTLGYPVPGKKTTAKLERKSNPGDSHPISVYMAVLQKRRPYLDGPCTTVEARRHEPPDAIRPKAAVSHVQPLRYAASNESVYSGAIKLEA